MKTEYIIVGVIGLIALYVISRPKKVGSVGYTGVPVYNPVYSGPPLGTSAASAPSNFQTALNAVTSLAATGASIYDTYSENNY